MSSPITIPRRATAPEEFLSSAPAELQGAKPRRRAFARFLGWLFLLPLVFYVPVIPLVRVPGYMRWWPSHWGPMLDFAWKSQGEDADVVIFGDSSAFLGVDPRLVNRQLGMKTLVLPNTVGSLPVMGDRALAEYLAHNKKPRLIVLYFTPWDLDYGETKESRMYEGEEMLLRHGTAAEIVRFAAQHPLELPAFPLRNYSSLGGSMVKTVARHDRAAETKQALGHVDYREIDTRVPASCTLPRMYVDQRGSRSIRELVAKYRAAGYRVEVYLAPIPGCRNDERFVSETYGGLASAPAAVLPPASFIQDEMYAHVSPAAVPETSKLFAEWLAGRLRTGSPPLL